MELLNSAIKRIDNFQRTHERVGFCFAVIKKYGDDQASYLGAIITYYSFLSLFPLIVVMTAVLRLVIRRDNHLRLKILGEVTHYFPVVGTQLESNIHGLRSTGLTLIIGLVVTLYGARGSADAVRNALNNMWLVPKIKRSGFFPAAAQSLSMIVVGGSGLLAAAGLSGYATLPYHSILIKIALSALSLLILVSSFLFIFKIGTSKALGIKEIALSAIGAGIGIQIIQTFGSYLFKHELEKLSNIYGTFALVISMFFWIYLQVQVMLYAIETSTIHKYRLWPRALNQSQLTSADKHFYVLQVDMQKSLAAENIKTGFKAK